MADTSGTSVIILKVTALDPIEDRLISKGQNECQICACPLGKKGTSQSQKHVCRFCFNAVCSACSPLTAVHPDKEESERICLKCYAKYLRIQIESEDGPKIQQMIDEEIKKIEQESYQNYAQELEKLRAEHRQREHEMNSYVQKLDNDIQEKELRISTMNLSATKGKDNNRKNDAVDKFIQEMKEKERENQELRKEIEAVKESHRKVATVENKGGCLKSCVVF